VLNPVVSDKVEYMVTVPSSQYTIDTLPAWENLIIDGIPVLKQDYKLMEVAEMIARYKIGVRGVYGKDWRLNIFEHEPEKYLVVHLQQDN